MSDEKPMEFVEIAKQNGAVISIQEVSILEVVMSLGKGGKKPPTYHKDNRKRLYFSTGEL